MNRNFADGLLEIPDFLDRRAGRICAQCNALGDDLEPRRDGDRLAWLHPECVRFWKDGETIETDTGQADAYGVLQ
jgi:hypothetical protein